MPDICDSRRTYLKYLVIFTHGTLSGSIVGFTELEVGNRRESEDKDSETDMYDAVDCDVNKWKFCSQIKSGDDDWMVNVLRLN